MCKYIIKKENDIKYYNNGVWVSKDNAEEFDWYNAENTARDLNHNGIYVISKVNKKKSKFTMWLRMEVIV